MHFSSPFFFPFSHCVIYNSQPTNCTTTKCLKFFGIASISATHCLCGGFHSTALCVLTCACTHTEDNLFLMAESNFHSRFQLHYMQMATAHLPLPFFFFPFSSPFPSTPTQVLQYFTHTAHLSSPIATL